jgi:hypothetical protein
LEQIRQRHEQLPALPPGGLAEIIASKTERAAGVPPAEAQDRPAGEMPAPRGVASSTRGADATGNLTRKLEAYGLLPEYARRVALDARRFHPAALPDSAASELASVSAALSAAWRQPPVPAPGSPWHVFVGAPGSGKTTCLCKWLAQSVLLAGCQARVWRLDGVTANTAESLSVFADVFGVPISRAWPADSEPADAEVHFVDLPGVSWREPGSIETLGNRLRGRPGVQLHLVLNAAYEVPLLLEQVDAFSMLPLADAIFTHLDEETRRGKLWNVVLGRNLAIGFLSAGQNVPGDFQSASAEMMLSGQWNALRPS